MVVKIMGLEMRPSNIVTVLDIGSTKVCCCIANTFDDGRFKIIGVGYCVCHGVRSGVIIDMPSVEKSIARAVERAEKMANQRIQSVYVSISGKNIESEIINISMKAGGRIIRDEDILKFFNYCHSVTEDRIAIHSIPILYSVDSLQGIKNPVGMVANNLSVNMNLVTVPKTQLDNLLMCLARCHLDSAGIVASIYASGLSVMDEDDLQNGKIVIDFGGETTSIGFFYNGIFSGMNVISLGGRNITDDIAYGFNISTVNAEKLKTLHGSAFVSIHDENNVVFIPVVEDDSVINLQKISKNSLNQIIQPRIEEILNLVKKQIGKSSFTDDFSRDVTITGGGSMLTGIKDFAQGIINKKIKIKKIEDNTDGIDIQISNDFSVAIGMIKFFQLGNNDPIKTNDSVKKSKNESFLKKTIAWIENNL
ncbi:MAG: cell division protein FtsA [Holosporaceae bacterium]|jgi:cell division protein FtsA|nr:cell division protein FtsA [Holosporaceae bacterium]